MSGDYFNGRARVDAVWVCPGCQAEYLEYCNGCPRCWSNGEKRHSLMCVPIYADRDRRPDETATLSAGAARLGAEIAVYGEGPASRYLRGAPPLAAVLVHACYPPGLQRITDACWQAHDDALARIPGPLAIV